MADSRTWAAAGEEVCATAAAPGEPQMNPKDRVAKGKVPLSLIPPSALVYCAMALRSGAYESPRADGGIGYDPYNWRAIAIQYMTYLDADLRHSARLIDREDFDPVSAVHALGHKMACCAILIDAIEGGWLIDDRPLRGPAPALLDRMKTFIAERTAAAEQTATPPADLSMVEPEARRLRPTDSAGDRRGLDEQGEPIGNVREPRDSMIQDLLSKSAAAFTAMPPEQRRTRRIWHHQV
jgi:hypothetical protein